MDTRKIYLFCRRKNFRSEFFTPHAVTKKKKNSDGLQINLQRFFYLLFFLFPSSLPLMCANKDLG